MRKNKKGFTLIELLVAIVIVVSILVLAVVSITKISDKKKEEAYVKVKETVETSGQQYFEANKYRFSDLDEGGDAGISLEELIDKDYLSLLTDPRTGKKLGKCKYVKVTKNSGNYSFKFIDNDDNCNIGEGVISYYVRQKGAPSFDFIFKGEKGLNDWFIKETYSYLKDIDLKENGKISYIEYCTGSNCTNYNGSNATSQINNINSNNSSEYKADEIDNTGTGALSYTYKLTNENNKFATVTKSVKVDKEPPKIVLSNAVSEYTLNIDSDSVDVEFKASDDGSGLDKNYGAIYGINPIGDTFIKKYDRLSLPFTSNLEELEVKDKAGNQNKQSITINKISSTPINNCSFLTFSVKSADDSKMVNGWYNTKTGKPKITYKIKPGDGANKITTVYIKKSNSLVNTYNPITNGTYTNTYTFNDNTDSNGKIITIIAKDDKGGECQNDVTLKYDGNIPSCSITVTKEKNSGSVVNGWYNISTGKPKIAYAGTDNNNISSVFSYDGSDSAYETRSGISISGNKTITNDTGTSYKTAKLNVTDIAGNTCETSTRIKYDATAPKNYANIKNSAETTYGDNNHVFDCIKCTDGDISSCTQLNAYKCEKGSSADLGFSYKFCEDYGSGNDPDEDKVKWNLNYTSITDKINKGNTGANFVKRNSSGQAFVGGSYRTPSFTGAKENEPVYYQLKCKDKAGNSSNTLIFKIRVSPHDKCWGRWYNGSNWQKHSTSTPTGNYSSCPKRTNDINW